jgi:hypothetical protein
MVHQSRKTSDAAQRGGGVEMIHRATVTSRVIAVGLAMLAAAGASGAETAAPGQRQHPIHVTGVTSGNFSS